MKFKVCFSEYCLYQLFVIKYYFFNAKSLSCKAANETVRESDEKLLSFSLCVLHDKSGCAICECI